MTGAHAKFGHLFDEKHDFGITESVTRAGAFVRLDEMGVDSVLEFIASGRLLAELAVSTNLPFLYVQEWADQNLDPKRVAVAQRMAAEVSVLKSQLSVSVTPDNPAEAQTQKAMSEQLRWMAERTNPDRWGPPRKADALPPPVNIVLNVPQKIASAPVPPLTIAARPTLALSPSYANADDDDEDDDGHDD